MNGLERNGMKSQLSQLHIQNYNQLFGSRTCTSHIRVHAPIHYVQIGSIVCAPFFVVWLLCFVVVVVVSSSFGLHDQVGNLPHAFTRRYQRRLCAMNHDQTQFRRFVRHGLFVRWVCPF